MSTRIGRSFASSPLSAFWKSATFAALIFPCAAISQGLGPAWQNYVDRVGRSNSLVFEASCIKAGNSKAALIVPYKSEMMLVEWDENGIANLAAVGSQSSHLVIEETGGGLYSYRRAQEVLDMVGRRSFFRISAKRLIQLNIPAQVPCEKNAAQ